MDETPSQHEAIEAIGEALSAIRGSSIAELEVEWEGGSLRIHRETMRVAQGPGAVEQSAPPPDDRVVVISEHVGYFYGGVGGPFPHVGAWVGAGALLGEIETLGIRNAVVAPGDGRVEEVLAEDGAAVEYGQRLVILRREPPPVTPAIPVAPAIDEAPPAAQT